MFTDKKLIAQYEAHIASLKEEIASLRALVFPSHSKIPLIAMEADAILSGKAEQVQLSERETNLMDEEMAERDRLLSGQY